MKRLVIVALVCCWATPLMAQPVLVDRSPAESDTLIILLGRACRSSNDQEWLAICTAAVAQAQKELEARKTKPAEPKQ